MSDVRVVAKFVPADEQRGKLAHWAYWFEWEEADGTPARQRYPAEVPLDVAEAIIADGSSALRARVAELLAALDLADCTQREGGDVRHCGEVRCWRCRAEAAEKRVAELEAALDAEKKQSAFYDLQAQRIMIQRDAAAAELNDAWKATEVAGTVRGLTTLADVVAVNRQNMKEAESRASAAEQRVAELEARLQFDPSGSDKIDELEQAIQFLRHELDVARTELGLKRSDCVRLGMDCDALNSEKRAAEQRVKRLEGALQQLAEMPCEIVATFSTEDEPQPSCVEIWPDPRDEARSLCGTCTARELRAALAASDEGAEVGHD